MGVEVYPRACGGTLPEAYHWLRDTGLSPRLRGNPCGRYAVVPCVGSIPAPAGEPAIVPDAPTVGRVYPRACGGTTSKMRSSAAADGLSPRLRGNLDQFPLVVLTMRSIPAPAGEPWIAAARHFQTWAYPRACGGTSPGGKWPAATKGLSPRLRGNPSRSSCWATLRRSIPAPAGEPGLRPLPFLANPVYPRACGGTWAKASSLSCQSGLSPRLRGNRAVVR